MDTARPKESESRFKELKSNISVANASSEQDQEVDDFSAPLNWSQPYRYPQGNTTRMDDPLHSTSGLYTANNGHFGELSTTRGSSGNLNNDSHRGRSTDPGRYGQHRDTGVVPNTFLGAFDEVVSGEFATTNDVDSDDDLPCFDDIPYALILAGVFSEEQLKKAMLKQTLRSTLQQTRFDRKAVPTIAPTVKPRPEKINKNKNTRTPKGTTMEKASMSKPKTEDNATNHSDHFYHPEGKMASSFLHSSRERAREQNTGVSLTEARKEDAIKHSKDEISANKTLSEDSILGKGASAPIVVVNDKQLHDSNAESKHAVAELYTNDKPKDVDKMSIDVFKNESFTNTNQSGISSDISGSIPPIPRTLASSPTPAEVEKYDQPQSSNHEPELPVTESYTSDYIPRGGNNAQRSNSQRSGKSGDMVTVDSVVKESPREVTARPTSVIEDGTVQCSKDKASALSEKLVQGPTELKPTFAAEAKAAKSSTEKHAGNESNSPAVQSAITKVDDFKGRRSQMYDSFDDDEEDIDEEDLPFAMSLVRPTVKRNRASSALFMLLSDAPATEGSLGGSTPGMDRSTLLISLRPPKKAAAPSRFKAILDSQVSSEGRNKHTVDNLNVSGQTIMKSFSAIVADQRHNAFMKTKRSTELAAITCNSCRRPECQGEQVVQMKSLVAAARLEGFDICDVISDGNCMFAAVVDQLRQYGDNSYETNTVREAAVNWLVENPCSADGTPFAKFMEESWDTYLVKMRNDGQWGDHVVLRAVSEFLGRTVRVLNPGNGDLWTDITPQTKAGPDVNDRPLYLGHMGEFHYTSLRYADRRDETALVQAPTPSVVDEDTSGDVDLSELTGHEIRMVEMFEENYIDEESKVPVAHFSFLLRTPLCEPQSAEACCGISLVTAPETLWFQIDLHELLKVSGKDGNSYMAPFPVMDGHRVVSKGEQNARPGDFVLDTESSHSGFTRLLDNQTNPNRFDGNFVPHSVCKTLTHNEMADRPGLISSTEVIHFHGWPEVASEWPARPRPEGWPKPSSIRDVIREGCHLVGEAHPSSLKPEVEWKFSFALAELTLFREEVTADQKTCYMLFVGLCLSALSGVPALFVEPLRSVFLIACERVPTEFWGMRKGSCILYMIKELHRYLDCRYLPNYFVVSNNMLDGIEEDRLKLAESCIRELNLHPLSNMTGITKPANIVINTRMVEHVSNDMPVFEADKNIKRSTLDVFVPLLNDVAKEKLTVGHYEMGYQLLTQAFEERLSVSTCDDTLPFPFFLTGALNGIDFPTAVWFCVYVTRQLGPQLSSSLLRDLRGDSELVKLEDVLPGDLVNVYGAADVPKKLSDDKLSLSLGFARFLARVRLSTPALRVFEHCHALYQQLLEQCGLRQMSGVANVEPLAESMMEVYTGLFHIHVRQGNTEGFRGYLSPLQDVCELVNTSGSLNLLSIIAAGMHDTQLVTKASQSVHQARITYTCEVLRYMFFGWPYYTNVSSSYC